MERAVEVVEDLIYDPDQLKPLDVSIDDDINVFNLIMDRTDWTEKHPDPLVSWSLKLAYDGGRWVDGGSSATHGGRAVSDSGGEVFTSRWAFTLPDGKARKARLVFMVHRKTRLRVEVNLLRTYTGFRGV